MIKVWEYRWLTPLVLAVSFAMPSAAAIYGTPSEGWLIFCWVFPAILLAALFGGAYHHMTRIHILMLERRWREANRSRHYYTEKELYELQRKLSIDPWWEE